MVLKLVVRGERFRKGGLERGALGKEGLPYKGGSNKVITKIFTIRYSFYIYYSSDPARTMYSSFTLS